MFVLKKYWHFTKIVKCYSGHIEMLKSVKNTTLLILRKSILLPYFYKRNLKQHSTGSKWEVFSHKSYECYLLLLSCVQLFVRFHAEEVEFRVNSGKCESIVPVLSDFYQTLAEPTLYQDATKHKVSWNPAHLFSFYTSQMLFDADRYILKIVESWSEHRKSCKSIKKWKSKI